MTIETWETGSGKPKVALHMHYLIDTINDASLEGRGRGLRYGYSILAAVRWSEIARDDEDGGG